MSETEALEVEVIDLQQELAVFDPVAAQIAEMKEKNSNLAFDYEDKEGNKGARSWIAVLRKLKKPITETHKLAKAEAKKFCDALDGKKKELLGVVEEMIEVHHKPIWEIEQKEMAEKADRELKIREAEAAAQELARLELEAREKAVADDRAAIEKVQAEIDRKEHERELLQEAQIRAEIKAKKALDDAENLRQREEEAAAVAAVAAENSKKQALIDADNRRLAEVQREKDKAKAEAADREETLAQEKRYAEAQLREKETAEKLRQSDVENRNKIHKEIYEDLLSKAGLIPSDAKAVGVALRDRKIRNVTINY